MILGRPTNLWNGLVVALVSLVSLILIQLEPDLDPRVVATIATATTGFLGAAIALIANGTPTVNSGDTVNVVTPAGEADKKVTVH